MAYLDDDLEGFDDEGGSLLTESDTYSWQSNGSGESVGPRYRPNYSRTGPTRVPRPAPAQPVGGLGGATLETPAGRAQMQFAKPVATKESVDASVRDIKRDLLALAETVKKVDTTVDKNTAILDKKVLTLEAALRKSQQSAQMGLLLPLLLNKPADLASLKLTETGLATPATPRTFTVDETKYKAADNNIGLLIAIMAMSGGGLGGGGGDGDSSNMLFLALALSGGLGGSK